MEEDRVETSGREERGSELFLHHYHGIKVPTALFVVSYTVIHKDSGLLWGRKSCCSTSTDQHWPTGGSRGLQKACERKQASPEEVDLMDGWQHDRHLTVSLKQKKKQTFNSSWEDIWKKCSQNKTVTLHLSWLDQLGGSWFVVAGRDSNLQKHKQIKFFLKLHPQLLQPLFIQHLWLNISLSRREFAHTQNVRHESLSVFRPLKI